MRIKFLPIIVSFLFVSLATTSCLDSDDNEIVYSPDATIKQFAIDTIHGVDYPFTINQLGINGDGIGLIYNQDSLPLGSDSIIHRILIKTLTTASGIITSYNPVAKQDTLVNIADSMDLRNPFTIRVWSLEAYANGEINGATKQYKIKVNVHKQDPDSMQWVKMSTPLPGSGFKAQKTAILKNDLFIYTAGAAYKGTVSTYGYATWTPVGRAGLPAGALTSLLSFKDNLYATTTGDKKVYQSADGETWSELIGLGDKVDALLAVFPENKQNLTKVAGLAGIVDGKFAVTDKDAATWTVSENDVDTDKFPELGSISSTSDLNATNIQSAFIMGNNRLESDTTSIVWTSQDGLDWIQLSTNSPKTSSCPELQNPSIIHYNDVFYAFGGGFNAFYKSKAGIAWYKADSKFWMPAEFKDKGDYSMVVDKDNHIWIMWSTGEVWRGRLNKLGFEPIVRY